MTNDLMVHLHRNEVDVVVLNDVSPELGRAVIRDGIRAFCRDHALDHAFVRDVQLLAADLDIFLRRMRLLSTHGKRWSAGAPGGFRAIDGIFPLAYANRSRYREDDGFVPLELTTGRWSCSG